MIREALVDSPLNHGRYLHGEGKGLVTVARKIPGKWEQRSYPTEQLYEILPAYGGVYDAYISQNRFWGPRSVSRLAQLSALYADLDYYKIPTLAKMHPLGVLELAFEALEQSKVPYPSFAVATGRGLALIWRHHPVPRVVLPRWRLCQESIYTTLKSLGADSQAKDAARVLRLVGTHNSKSGTPVETVWEDQGEAVWYFDDVANELLPFSREEWEERRGENRQKIASKGRRESSEGREDIERRFTLSTLALDRLSDLQRLLKLRNLDKLPSGQRNAWMFAAGSSLAYLVEAQFLERELIVLGRENADWSAAETRSRMHTVISRAKDASKGETVEWKGQERDPRYHLTNQKIIDDLNITTTEEKEMKVIISKDTKRQRGTERKERERRSKGAIPRDEYLARASKKRNLAYDLYHRHGMSLREIGEILDVSHTQVRRMIVKQEAQ